MLESNTVGGSPIDNKINTKVRAAGATEGDVGVGITVDTVVVPEQGSTSPVTMLRILNISLQPSRRANSDVTRFSKVLSENQVGLENTQKERGITLAEQKRRNLAEQNEKRDESLRNLEEAQRVRKKSGFLGVLGSVFSAIGAIVTIGTGAVLSGTGVGTALLVAGTASLLATIDGVIQQETGHGMFGHLASGIAIAVGASPDAAERIGAGFDLTYGVSLAVVAVVASIVALRVDKVVTSPLDKAATGARLIVAQQIATATSLMTQMGSTATQLGGSIINNNAARHTADSYRQNAKTQELRAENLLTDDLIQQALTFLQEIFQTISAKFSLASQVLNEKGKTLSNIRYTG